MAPSVHGLRWDIDMSDEERRCEIMRALSGVLREKHLSSLTMQQIADRLGMTKANLYNYFKSKQDLLYQSHVKAMENSSLILEHANADGATPGERFRALMIELVERIVEDPYGAVLTTDLDSLSVGQRRHYLALRDQFERGVRDILRQGNDSGEFKIPDVKLAGFALLGSVNWISRWFRVEGERTPEQIGEAFADLFLGAFRAG